MGIITKLLVWLGSPLTGDNNPKDWLYALVLLALLSFMWTQVLKRL